MNEATAIPTDGLENDGGPSVEGNVTGHAMEDEIIGALRSVYDPEIPVNVFDLGLIYRVDVSETNDVSIDMTLTAPGCPVAEEMPGMVASAFDGIEGLGDVRVDIVWEPPWTMERMSEIARIELGFF